MENALGDHRRRSPGTARRPAPTGALVEPRPTQRLGETAARQTMKRRLAYFVGGSVLAWLLVNGVGRLAAARFPDQVAWAERETVYSAVAVALCLIPTTLTLLWSAWALRQTPDLQLVSVLGGTGVRMFFVLAAGLALWAWVPYFGDNS